MSNRKSNKNKSQKASMTKKNTENSKKIIIEINHNYKEKTKRLKEEI